MDAHSVLHTSTLGGSTLGGYSRSIYPEDHIVQKMTDPVSQPHYAYVKALLLYDEPSDFRPDHYREIRKLKNLFEPEL